MNFRSILRRFCLPVFLVFGTLFDASGQLGNTAYHMYGIPQASQMNPAFQPSCNFYLGMPLLSPIKLDLGFSSLQYKDIFTWDEARNQFLTFMHPDADKDMFMSALRSHNNFRVALNTDILSFGFKKNNLFVSFDITERIENTIVLPEDFFEFAIFLTRNQDRFSFADMGESFKYYREIALGISYNMDDEFQVGGRAKLLLGVANADLRVTQMDLLASLDKWEINSQMDVNISAPVVVTETQSDGKLDSLYLDDNVATPDLISTALGFGNPGFAVDFGFLYRPMDVLTLSGSINDLGFISWRKNVVNLTNQGGFTFDGLEFDILGNGQGDNGDGPLNEIMDSLTSQLDFYASNDPYTTLITGSFNLGAAYELSEKVRFGVVNRTTIYKYKFYNQFTLSANVQPIRAFSATASYSVIGGNFANLGLGLSMYLGPLNLYFITDQIPSAALIPTSIQSVNFRLGMNMVFGRSKRKQALKDQPLIY